MEGPPMLRSVMNIIADARTLVGNTVAKVERTISGMTKNNGLGMSDAALKHYILGLLAQRGNTEDFVDLEEFKWTRVFLYGPEMHGGHRHSIIQDIYRKKDNRGLCTNPSVVTVSKYETWITLVGKESKPVALVSKAKKQSQFNGTVGMLAKASRLKGRLYFIRSDMMYLLDRVHVKGIEYDRKLVEVELPYRILDPSENGCQPTEEQGYVGKAFMYVGVHKFWDPFVDHGEINFTIKKCPLKDPEIKYYKDKPYFIPPKKWIKEPYCFFNAHEYNNLQE
jgi:hypothetical protein